MHQTYRSLCWHVRHSIADDGAAIVAANKEAKKPEKAIDGDDDSYMKNSCSAHKWVIIELSQVRLLSGVGVL
jgi:hypothetical protein